MSITTDKLVLPALRSLGEVGSLSKGRNTRYEPQITGHLSRPCRDTVDEIRFTSIKYRESRNPQKRRYMSLTGSEIIGRYYRVYSV